MRKIKIMWAFAPVRLRSPSAPGDFTDHWPLTTVVENQPLTPAPSPSLLRIQPMVFTS